MLSFVYGFSSVDMYISTILNVFLSVCREAGKQEREIDSNRLIEVVYKVRCFCRMCHVMCKHAFFILSNY